MILPSAQMRSTPEIGPLQILTANETVYVYVVTCGPPLPPVVCLCSTKSVCHTTCGDSRMVP
jgi:hypothetical protein